MDGGIPTTQLTPPRQPVEPLSWVPAKNLQLRPLHFSHPHATATSYLANASRCGGIGRRGGLKIRCPLKTCGFESLRRDQLKAGKSRVYGVGGADSIARVRCLRQVRFPKPCLAGGSSSRPAARAPSGSAAHVPSPGTCVRSAPTPQAPSR